MYYRPNISNRSDRRGCPPATIEAYIRELEQFRAYCKTNHLRITQVTPKVVTDYLKYLQTLRPSEGEAVRRRMSALSAYFKYVGMVTNGRIRNPLAPLRRPRRQRPNAKPVDDVVLETLLAGITVARDRAIVMLFASSGLRLSELVSLDRGSIQIEVTPHGEGAQVIGIGRVIGKGQKEREFLVDLPTLKQLHAYERERGQDEIPALFLSNRKTADDPAGHPAHASEVVPPARIGADPSACASAHGRDDLASVGHGHVEDLATAWPRLRGDDRDLHQAGCCAFESRVLRGMEVLAPRGAPALPAPDDEKAQP